MTEKRKKVKHFERDVSANPIQILDSDIEIFNLLFKHRFLNRKQINALTNPNSERYQRIRLKQLFDNAYIDRPNAQRGRFGNFPMVYALGNRGAEILIRKLNIEFPKVNWTWKNNQVKDKYFDHTLLVSQCMAMFETACRKLGYEFISPQQIIRERQIKAEALKDPLSWTVDFKYNKKNYSLLTVPDSAFGIRKPGDKVKWYFLEADRGTETVTGFTHKKRTFFEKMVKYNRSYYSNLFSKIFNFKSARVLTVTPSKKRIETMIGASQSLPYDYQYLGMFLFITEDKMQDLENPETILESIWVNGRNEKEGLV